MLLDAVTRRLKMNTVDQATENTAQEATGLNQQPADDFMSLDDLLAGATADLAEAARAKASKKLMPQSGAWSRSRKDSLRNDTAQEVQHYWTPVANVAMFDVQVCTYCGARHRHFRGVFQEQKHNTNGVTRWSKFTPAENLPQRVKENIFKVEMCGSCCSTKGWI
jgi:sulfur relay (sulfurtransferase) complex TusBCD TusD component (DsrE family)